MKSLKTLLKELDSIPELEYSVEFKEVVFNQFKSAMSEVSALIEVLESDAELFLPTVNKPDELIYLNEHIGNYRIVSNDNVERALNIENPLVKHRALNNYPISFDLNLFGKQRLGKIYYKPRYEIKIKVTNDEFVLNLFLHCLGMFIEPFSILQEEGVNINVYYNGSEEDELYNSPSDVYALTESFIKKILKEDDVFGLIELTFIIYGNLKTKAIEDIVMLTLQMFLTISEQIYNRDNEN